MPPCRFCRIRRQTRKQCQRIGAINSQKISLLTVELRIKMTARLHFASALLFAAAGTAAFLTPEQTTSPSISLLTSSSATILSAKNPDRARIEKELEDIMDHDWRAFRARLVMNEALEAKEVPNSVDAADGDTIEDENLEKQHNVGKLFAGAISSIFSPRHHQQQQDKDKVFVSNHEKTTSGVGSTSDVGSDSSIFDGDSVGGATSESSLPTSCEDPFISAAELPVIMQPKGDLDKHRWAHPIPHVEPGCVLVANERLGGVFHQTVVLIIDHHEASGSTGIVINRPMQGNLLQVAQQTPSNVDLSLKLAFNSATVSYGGPVLQEEYSILHGYGEVEGAKKVAPGVFVGGSEELMSEVRRHNFRPEKALFVKGHAAWVSGQLSREIAKGVWYPCAVSADLILRYAGAPIVKEDNERDLWSDILTCMGGDYQAIAEQHSGRGDMRMMP